MKKVQIRPRTQILVITNLRKLLVLFFRNIFKGVFSSNRQKIDPFVGVGRKVPGQCKIYHGPGNPL